MGIKVFHKNISFHKKNEEFLYVGGHTSPLLCAHCRWHERHGKTYFHGAVPMVQASTMTGVVTSQCLECRETGFTDRQVCDKATWPHVIHWILSLITSTHSTWMRFEQCFQPEDPYVWTGCICMCMCVCVDICAAGIWGKVGGVGGFGDKHCHLILHLIRIMEQSRTRLKTKCTFT